MDQLTQFLGRLHPLVVHFPIALLLLAALLEAVRLVRGSSRSIGEAAYVCLWFGAVGATVAAGAGWLYAEGDPPGKAVADELFWHRWVGVATAVVSLVAAVVASRVRSSGPAASGPTGLYFATLFASAVLVGGGSHLGGELVYGEGYLFEVFEEKRSHEDPIVPEDPGTGAESYAPGVPDETPPVEPEPLAEEEVEPSPAPSTAAVDYATEIRPIFEARCFDCHGPTGRAKAGLRLEPVEEMYSGDPEYWVIVPGDASKSYLVELIALPAGSEDIMPADGDPLTAEEIELISRWVNEGARATPAESSESVGDPTESEEETSDASDASAPRPTVDEVARAIREFGGYAAPISRGSSDYGVNLGLRTDRTTDATLEMLVGLEPYLVELDLSRTAITNQGLERLSAFTRLESLRVDGTAIDDAALVNLGALESLEVLNLVNTTVTDAGLETLAGFASLRRIFVWRTGVTQDGIERLRLLRPELEVEPGASPVEKS